MGNQPNLKPKNETGAIQRIRALNKNIVEDSIKKELNSSDESDEAFLKPPKEDWGGFGDPAKVNTKHRTYRTRNSILNPQVCLFPFKH